MEKKMETTIVHWGNIGIIEKRMETTMILFPKQPFLICPVTLNFQQ